MGWRAAGASEPRNLGYMERLGLWGPGNTAFPDFAAFLAAIGSRGVAALELVAMDLKAQGVYVARTLSYSGATAPAARSCSTALRSQLTSRCTVPGISLPLRRTSTRPCRACFTTLL